MPLARHIAFHAVFTFRPTPGPSRYDLNALRALEESTRASLGAALACVRPTCDLRFDGSPIFSGLARPPPTAAAGGGIGRRGRRALQPTYSAEALAAAAAACQSTLRAVEALTGHAGTDPSCAAMRPSLNASYAGFSGACPDVSTSTLGNATTCGRLHDSFAPICAALRACSEAAPVDVPSAAASNELRSCEA